MHDRRAVLHLQCVSLDFTYAAWDACGDCCGQYKVSVQDASSSLQEKKGRLAT
jgi:hypothetical protein